jgi:formate dehydrogenase beta subunit
MRKDGCMHCADPGCLTACPADGAIVQYQNGIVDFQQDNCIGCQYCVTGCPFNVPKFNPHTKRVFKCTLCSDRVSQGLEPACIKACPTGCLHFGTKDDMKTLAESRAQQLREHSGFANAGVYDPPGVGGTGVMYVLHDTTNTKPTAACPPIRACR